MLRAAHHPLYCQYHVNRTLPSRIGPYRRMSPPPPSPPDLRTILAQIIRWTVESHISLDEAARITNLIAPLIFRGDASHDVPLPPFGLLEMPWLADFSTGSSSSIAFAEAWQKLCDRVAGRPPRRRKGRPRTIERRPLTARCPPT